MRWLNPLVVGISAGVAYMLCHRVQVDFVIQEQTNQSPDKMFSIVEDAKILPKIHPHVKRVEETEKTDKLTGSKYIEQQITEENNLIGTMTITNIKTVNEDTRTIVNIVYPLSGLMHLNTTVQVLETSKDNSIIREEVAVLIPWCLKGYVENQIITIHTQMYQNARKYAETIK